MRNPIQAISIQQSTASSKSNAPIKPVIAKFKSTIHSHSAMKGLNMGPLKFEGRKTLKLNQSSYKIQADTSFTFSKSS